MKAVQSDESGKLSEMNEVYMIELDGRLQMGLFVQTLCSGFVVMTIRAVLVVLHNG